MLEKLDALAKTAADRIRTLDFVRVLSHHDADGIAAAGVICNTLLRQKIPFQATLLSSLDEESIKDIKENVIICDMGSSQIEVLRNLKNVIIIDHHKPIDNNAKFLQVNPHLAGIDGAFELTASGTAYAVAKQIDPSNVDLAGLAICGTVGDKQQMIGANRDILDEALARGVVSISKDLLNSDGTLKEILEYNSEPYFEITGDEKKIEEFLKQLKLEGNRSYRELNEEEKRRFISAMMLKLMKQSSPESIEELIGEIYFLNSEVYSHSLGFANILNACGKLGKAGLALSLCLRDSTQLNEARKLHREYQKKVIAEVRAVEGKIKKCTAIQYVKISDPDVTSAVSGSIMRYVTHGVPLLVLSQDEKKIKVSARGSKRLVEMGLNLADALREGAKKAGGVGGGHSVASGASLPFGTENIFIQTVDEIVAKQLKKGS